MKNKLMNMVNNIGDKVKTNALLYAGVGLTALTVACNGPKRTNEIIYEDRIGDSFFYVEKSNTTYEGKTNSYYTIDEITNDGTEIRYKGGDSALYSVALEHANEKRQLYFKNAVFNCAEKKYLHVLDTIPEIKTAKIKVRDAAASKADSATIDKYFK